MENNELEQYSLPFKNSVALVPAAGLGTRLGLGPKAFLQLGGKTLLERVVTTLKPCVERILVAVPEGYLEQTPSLVGKDAEVYIGSDSYQATVFKLFEQSVEDIIVIQPVVRPFITKELLCQTISKVKEHSIIAACSQPTTPVGVVESTFATQIFSRSEVVINQVPYVFRRATFEKLYNYATSNQLVTQGLFEIIPMINEKIKIVPGDETNIKITTALDWEIAQKVIAPKFGWV